MPRLPGQRNNIDTLARLTYNIDIPTSTVNTNKTSSQSTQPLTSAPHDATIQNDFPRSNASPSPSANSSTLPTEHQDSAMEDDEDLIEPLQERNNNTISARETTVRSHRTRSAEGFNEPRESSIAGFEAFGNRELIGISSEEEVSMHEDTLTEVEQEVINSGPRFFTEFELDTEADAMGLSTSDDYDILQDPQPLTLRQYVEDLESDSESDNEPPATTPSAGDPRSSSYDPPNEAASPTPSGSSEGEIVPKQGGKDIMPPPLHLAFGLWFEKSGNSRADYARLREILQIPKPSAENITPDLEDPTHTLPKKLDTLKRQVRRHIPLLQLMRRAIKVTIEKLPSLAEKQKGRRQRERIERLAWQYWYEPLDLIQAILSATKLCEKMHFGMAQFVDEPTELWHSRSWGSSIKSTSGDVCYTSNHNIIIPGDILEILSPHSAPLYKYGRVTFIGRDFRQQAIDINEKGEVLLELEVVVDGNHSLLKNFDQDILTEDHEFFIVEDIQLNLSLTSMGEHLSVYIDRDFDEEDDNPPSMHGNYIRRVLNVRTRTIRSVRQLHQTRGELEVECYGRERLSEAFGKPHLSLPYLLFIDDFGVHRNNYRSLKAFYLTPAALSYKERRKVANVFTLTLGPHGAKIEDIIGSISKSMRRLDRGVDLIINGEAKFVCAFGIALLGDMPQQAHNGGFLHHSARMGCRTCYCPREERGNLEFDVVREGRYHREVINQREYAKDLVGKNKTAYLQEMGIKENSPAVARLVPSLDLILSRTYDAPHSEWRGLGRILQSLLITRILSKRGGQSYIKAFQHFRYPSGWPRIQSPIFYIWSWSLSESGRASLLIPLILRCHATGIWFDMSYLQKASRLLPGDDTGIRKIIKAFAIIAKANTLVGSQRYTYVEELHEVILAGRQAYQNLIQCVIGSAEGSGNENSGNEGFRDEENAVTNADAVSDENNVLQEVLSDAVLSDDGGDSENDVLPLQGRAQIQKPFAEKKRGRKYKGDKYKKLLALPNVHAGLHLADMAREYATVMNLNVLSYEMKHMIFKAMADHAAPPNLMGYLFSRDVMSQSMRLGLAGSWEYYPQLTEALTLLQEYCPLLVRGFLPIGEHIIDEDADGAHAVTSDANHQRAQLSLMSFKLSGRLSVNPTMNPPKIPPQHPFIQELLDAYMEDYGKRVVGLGSKRFRWYTRIAFTDKDNHRRVFNVGDYVIVGARRGRLNQCFLHIYRRRKYAFAIIDVIAQVYGDDQEPLRDPVLDLPVYRQSSTQSIYGLPALSAESLYLIEAPHEPDWQLTETINQYLLQCDWGVAYL